MGGAVLGASHRTRMVPNIEERAEDHQPRSFCPGSLSLRPLMGWVGVVGWMGGAPVLDTSPNPLLRWQQLEALKEEKLLQLTRAMEVCSLLQESEPTRAQLLSVISRLEALGTRSSGDSHRTLQQTQQKVLVLEKKISYLQKATIEYGQLWDGDGGRGDSEDRGKL